VSPRSGAARERRALRPASTALSEVSDGVGGEGRTPLGCWEERPRIGGVEAA